MDPNHRRAYTGRSGQRAVMAELLDLGCNVAIPEVDVGRDLFAFQDNEGGATHIQVKTAGKPLRLRTDGSSTAQIDVPLTQLKLPDNPPLYYAFAMRVNGKWADFIVIGREASDGRYPVRECAGGSTGRSLSDGAGERSLQPRCPSFHHDE